MRLRANASIAIVLLVLAVAAWPAAAATLTVRTVPADAGVYLDGAYLDDAPCVIGGLPAGIHQITIFPSDGPSIAVPLTVVDGVALCLTAFAAPERGSYAWAAVESFPDLGKGVDVGNMVHRSLSWDFHGETWTYTLSYPSTVDAFYHALPREWGGDYTRYALSSHDREYLHGLAGWFADQAEREEYSTYEQAMHALALVQSLTYREDNDSVGLEEYPRYPLETLAAGGGDCEDTAILAAALLSEMGYDPALIEFPGHISLGIRCDGASGRTWYESGGNRYCYLETTGVGWEIGELPDEYRSVRNVTVLPARIQPRMQLLASAHYLGTSRGNVTYRMHFEVENTGSGTATDLSVAIEPSLPFHDTVTLPLPDLKEGAYGVAETTISVPDGDSLVVRCTLTGTNVEPVTAMLERP
ncbi:MAG: PEGA domain-containing protein [Methanobacteriota archaeon]|nr:MAG: PEGA domain-containing protein [Euryarchaeota archaeon]